MERPALFVIAIGLLSPHAAPAQVLLEPELDAARSPARGLEPAGESLPFPRSVAAESLVGWTHYTWSEDGHLRFDLDGTPPAPPDVPEPPPPPDAIPRGEPTPRQDNVTPRDDATPLSEEVPHFKPIVAIAPIEDKTYWDATLPDIIKLAVARRANEFGYRVDYLQRGRITITAPDCSKFRRQLEDILNSVHDSYLDLHLAYRSLDEALRRRETTLGDWRSVHYLQEAGRRGGEALELLRAEVLYFRALALVQQRTDDLFSAERSLQQHARLRLNKGWLIRPLEEPMVSHVTFDWEGLVTALQHNTTNTAGAARGRSAASTDALAQAVESLRGRHAAMLIRIDEHHAAHRLAIAAQQAYERDDLDASAVTHLQWQRGDTEVATVEAVVNHTRAVKDVFLASRALGDYGGVYLEFRSTRSR